MVKSFYEEIKKRKMNGEKLSALESVILLESATMEDRLAFHDQRCRQFLEDIDRQEAHVSAFQAILDQAQKYGQSMARSEMNSLPPRKLSQLCRCQQLHTASEVYIQMRKGISNDEIAKNLGVSADEVRNQQRKLIRFYKSIGKEHYRHSPADPYFRTLNTLLAGVCRVFRRADTGVNSYYFYHKDRLIGTASAQILPDFPLIIQSDGLILSSSFNPENTVFHGVSRAIFDVDHPAVPYARLIWLDTNEHRLELNYSSGTLAFDIKSREEEHFFYRDGKLIASIHPISLPQRIGEWDLCYCQKTYSTAITDPQAVVFLCFPLLRFS